MTHFKVDRLRWTWLPAVALALCLMDGAAMAGAPKSLPPPPPKPPRLYIQADPRLFASDTPPTGDIAADVAASPDAAPADASLSADEPGALSTRIVVADRKDDRDWALKSPYDYNSSRVTNLMDDVGLDELRIEMKTRF